MRTYCAVMPPSITSSEPVTQDDSSDARNSTPLAISKGGAEPAHRRAIEQRLAHCRIAEALLGQRRIRIARMHRIDADLFSRILQRRRLGEDCDGALGGRIGGRDRTADNAHD